MTEHEQQNTEWTTNQGDAARDIPGADATGSPEPDAAEARREELDQAEEELRAGVEQFGEAAVKFAQEAGFAFAGFAGLVGDKAKSFYEEQKQQYAQTHPEAEKDPGAKEFLNQLSDRLNRFVDDLTRGFKDMAERGRETFDKADGASNAPAPGGPSPAADKPSMVNTDADLFEEPASNDADAGIVEDDRDI